MAGVNKVILLGNIGKEPEVRYLENGSVVCNFTIATTETYKNKAGERVDNTEWHEIEMWEGLAKIAEKHLHKGDSIYLEGKIKTDLWQDNEGKNRKTVKIRVNHMTMLPKTGKSNNQSQQSSNNGTSVADGDDLPF